jgi:hypothetical protein
LAGVDVDEGPIGRERFGPGAKGGDDTDTPTPATDTDTDTDTAVTEIGWDDLAQGSVAKGLGCAALAIGVPIGMWAAAVMLAALLKVAGSVQGAKDWPAAFPAASDALATAGDALAGPGLLLTGFAVLASVVAVLLQQRELVETRREMARQSAEMVNHRTEVEQQRRTLERQVDVARDTLAVARSRLEGDREALVVARLDAWMRLRAVVPGPIGADAAEVMDSLQLARLAGLPPPGGRDRWLGALDAEIDELKYRQDHVTDERELGRLQSEIERIDAAKKDLAAWWDTLAIPGNTADD